MTSAMETPICPRCVLLEERLRACEKRLAELEAKLAATQKNSANSSKPPSSDIVKPPKDGVGPGKKKKKRRRGGQPGHARHDRPAFAADQVDKTWEYRLDCCPDCGGKLQASSEPPKVVQQVELVAKPIEVSEHRGLAGFCPCCQKVVHAPIDAEVRRAGLVGPHLTALVAYLKGACHCSYTTIRKLLRDVVGVTISRGQLAKVIAKVSASLAAVYGELLEQLPSAKCLNVDETGHKDEGKRLWTWCFRAELFTLFKISPSRGSDVLLEVLGREFDGVLGCDYFSAYRKYMGECNVVVQFCLAHLIRDVKFLTTHPERRNRDYGKRVLEALRELFRVIHRRETLGPRKFAQAIEDAANTLWGTAANWRVPYTKEAENLAKRFHKHGKAYLRFITTPGVEPTNNLAEQAIRFVVLDRHVTQGTRGATGQRWCERIWTVLATCSQQARSVFAFICESIDAYLHNRTAPSLLPNTS